MPALAKSSKAVIFVSLRTIKQATSEQAGYPEESRLLHRRYGFGFDFAFF